jgi:hypothetical protein
MILFTFFTRALRESRKQISDHVHCISAQWTACVSLSKYQITRRCDFVIITCEDLFKKVHETSPQNYERTENDGERERERERVIGSLRTKKKKQKSHRVQWVWLSGSASVAVVVHEMRIPPYRTTFWAFTALSTTTLNRVPDLSARITRLGLHVLHTPPNTLQRTDERGGKNVQF